MLRCYTDIIAEESRISVFLRKRNSKEGRLDMDFSLHGLKIIQTAQVFAGPIACRLLADWGADVIRIEHPARGDISRGQDARQSAARMIASDIDYVAENFNRNKRGITLDLSKPTGLEIMYRLLETADVLVSSFRQREIVKFGLEYHRLSKSNPMIITANVSGYGTRGPDRDLPGYEYTGYFARTGILHVLTPPGSFPPHFGRGLGDNVTGLTLTIGILTALLTRERTGLGQEVDVSLFQTGVFANAVDIAGSLITGQDRRMPDRRDMSNAMANFYETKDGRWIRLSVLVPDPYWSRFCTAIERPDLEHDSRFDTFDGKIDNHEALFDILVDAFKSKTLKDWKPRLDAGTIPWAPVQNLPEVCNDAQAIANGFFIAYDHPIHGRIRGIANPIRLSRTESVQRMPCPDFGQHTEEVLLEHGFSWEDIARFKEEGIIA